MMTKIQLRVFGSILGVLAIAYFIQLGRVIEQESNKKQSLELHKCREFIIHKGDTVEVIYTIHEYRHFRKMADPNYVETRFTNP